jgi:mannose-1-phosphate guanylyltransferase/mannose-6-phosphate isomerase
MLFSSPEEILVVTGGEQEFMARDQADEIGCACMIIAEPSGKNTLPAVYRGMQEIEGQHGHSPVAILPSDHMVQTGPLYASAFARAEQLADDYLVLFGVNASSAHTGYGYIRPGESLEGAFRVGSFAEKPDLETARRYVAEGYLWNSGMFLFSTRLFFEECRVHAPEVSEAFAQPTEEAYQLTPALSIDYGLMEKTTRAAVVPLETAWDDLGTFDSLYAVLPKQDGENAVRGEYLGIDSSKNLVFADRMVITVGVNDTTIIDTGDITFIIPRGRAEEVRRVVEVLRERKDPRADTPLTEHRPWGFFTRLEDGHHYRIKRITVPPGRRLSLQMHHHRSEHWVVVNGTARVTLDSKEFLLRKGESTFVHIGAVHRLENPGLIPLEIIEVQIGDHITEDDIVRFSDDYHRVEK